MDATAVIRAEIESCAGQNPRVQKHLSYYGMMTETSCDYRIAHLVGGSGRFPANMSDALAKAAREEGARGAHPPGRRVKNRVTPGS